MPSLIIALLENENQARVISECLENDGFTVTVVQNFSMAKNALKKEVFDLILSDVHLQNGGTVFDFLKWVKNTPSLKPIPVVLLSVEPSQAARYLSDGISVAARVLGAAKYICMDSFDPKILLEELAELFPERKSKSITKRTQPLE